MEPSLFFSLLAAGISLGGILIGFGVIKGKVAQNAEANKTQSEQLENCASKNELAAAIRRSDELLDIMQKRAEEDRSRGEGHYKELYSLIGLHGERIGKLEMSQEQIFKLLDKLDSTVSGGFRDVRQDMKELRQALNQG
jgi:hypothetical protein